MIYPFESRCPKCQSPPIVRAYCKSCKEVKSPDHHHCECGNCWYSWVSRCADAPKTKTKDSKKKPGGGKSKWP